jgi:hypothetical protein
MPAAEDPEFSTFSGENHENILQIELEFIEGNSRARAYMKK